MRDPSLHTYDNFYAIAGNSPNDIWVVGSGIWHWDGVRFSDNMLVGFGGVTLYSVSATPSGDAWASGSNEFLFRWYGNTWNVRWDIEPFGVAANLAYSTGGGPEDVWAISQTGSHDAVAQHFEGTACASPVPVGLHTALGFFGPGTNEMWVVGVNADPYPNTVDQIAHWDGSTWSVPYVGPVSQPPYTGIWASAPNDVWVVGSLTPSDSGNCINCPPNGSIMHFDGASTMTYTVPPNSGSCTGQLAGVWGSAPNDVWAVGACGTILHWDGNAWSRSPSPTTNSLFAVWGINGQLWAVGANGTVLRRP